MNISRLIKYLEHIQNKYGDMPIGGNIIGGERMNFVSLCVEDNSAYDSGYELLLELEEPASDIPIFNVYEYPSINNINL